MCTVTGLYPHHHPHRTTHRNAPHILKSRESPSITLPRKPLYTPHKDPHRSLSILQDIILHLLLARFSALRYPNTISLSRNEEKDSSQKPQAVPQEHKHINLTHLPRHAPLSLVSPAPDHRRTRPLASRRTTSHNYAPQRQTSEKGKSSRRKPRTRASPPALALRNKEHALHSTPHHPTPHHITSLKHPHNLTISVSPTFSFLPYPALHLLPLPS